MIVDAASLSQLTGKMGREMAPRSEGCRGRAHHLTRGGEMVQGICSECGAYDRVRRGLCARHYQRWLKARNADRVRPPCQYEGCSLPEYCRGWCKVHYDRVWRDGDPGAPYVPKTYTERIWSKFVKSPTGCWLWEAAIGTDRYGDCYVGNGRHINAHKAMYELIVGPVPQGLCLDHLCRTPACVNPSHLEVVTFGENVRRGLSANRETCKSGRHLWIPENWYVRSDGKRQCRLCTLERRRRREMLSR